MKKHVLTGVFLLLAASLTAQTHVNYNLIARNQGQWVTWDNDTLRTFGFTFGLGNPPLPAPTLYSNQGDSVHLNLWNISQGDPHTIHLHGLDVDQENDGVPHTSWVIEHYKDSTYHFRTDYPGTYLYHCHVNSAWHVQMGMYGAFIVRSAGGARTVWTGGPAFDKDYLWLSSEVDREWHDSIPAHDPTDTTHEHVHLPPYLPDDFLISGKTRTQLNDTTIALSARAGEKIYLRLANIGYYYNEVIFPPALQARIYESDGRPLPASVRTDTVVYTPGERYGVLLSPITQFTQYVQVRYIEPNTGRVVDTELVPVTIQGAIGRDEPLTDARFTVYPNPSAGQFVMEWQGQALTGQLSLLDLTGRTLLQRELSLVPGMQVSVQEALPAGIYLLQVRSGSQVWTRRLSIQ